MCVLAFSQSLAHQKAAIAIINHDAAITLEKEVEMKLENRVVEMEEEKKNWTSDETWNLEQEQKCSVSKRQKNK